MTKSIIFLHPDLGIGGAERLVVDAAVALKSKGFDVSFVTSYHNVDHCFKETVNDLKVEVVGDWIPRSFLGRFFALFAYLKMIYCAFYIIFFKNVDLVFCDLVSVCIPILHLTVKKVVFYCHFPDQLLSKEEGFLKRIYRLPLNWLEEKTTNCADIIYVNSEFTKKIFAATFQSIRREPTVLYPSINTTSIDREPMPVIATSRPFIISINRFERKKHIELLLNALKEMKDLPAFQELSHLDQMQVVLAGGYDPRVKENVEYYDELVKIRNSDKFLEERVCFAKSPSDSLKIELLKKCSCLVYTSPNEHFGIVPLEAMYCKKPVVACNSGGPTETVVDGETGFLCEFNAKAFAHALIKIMRDTDAAIKMGVKGHERFIEKFGFETFSRKLCDDIKSLLEINKNS